MSEMNAYISIILLFQGKSATEGLGTKRKKKTSKNITGK